MKSKGTNRKKEPTKLFLYIIVPQIQKFWRIKPCLWHHIWLFTEVILPSKLGRNLRGSIIESYLTAMLEDSKTVLKLKFKIA